MATTKKKIAKKKPTMDRVEVKRPRRRLYEAPPEPDPAPAADMSDPASATNRAMAQPVATNWHPQSRQLIKDYVIGAMALSTVPVPIVDLVTVTLLQTRMVYKLTRLYGADFDANSARSWIITLVGTAATIPLSISVFASLVKIVPGAGSWLGAMSLPLLSGASTYAVGVVFAQHFESGRSFLTVDPIGARERYQSALGEGKSVAKALRA